MTHKPLSRRDMRVSCSLQLHFLFVVALLCSCLLTPSVSFVTKMTRMVSQISQQSSLRMVAEIILSATDETSFKVVSFNILAPCYNKIKGEVNAEGGAMMEAEFKDKYMHRNQAICNQLIQSNADIICLQEYWSGSEELRDLFKSILCGPKGAGYTFTEQRRTSHWRIRDDGLACFVKDERIVIQDTRAILFHDCGDRVAQMLLLALRPPVGAPSDTPAQQFICVNTHLLFPHNEYSTKIRLRELAKILGFVESYRMRELCSTICGRSDVRLPVIIAGDFNGSPRGAVYNFARSQNYYSAFEEYCKALEPKELSASDSYISDEPITGREGRTREASPQDLLGGLKEHDLLKYDFGNGDDEFVTSLKLENAEMLSKKTKGSLILSEMDLEPEHEKSAFRMLVDAELRENNGRKPSMRSTWISHRSHRQENVPVDHIFYLNPSEQEEKRLPPIPDWTNLVYREIFLRMTENQEIRSIQDIFETFDTANKSFITLEEFKNALVTLGFIGEGKSALTDEEITVLVSCADKDGNGMIDYKEFCDRFWLAANDKEQQQLYSYRFGKKSFFARSNWLSSDLSVSEPVAEEEDFSMGENISIISAKASNLKSETIVETAKKIPAPSKLGLLLGDLSSTFSAGAKLSLNTRHMADLSIESAQLLPKELEEGIWPDDYKLSDHGMVEVVFKVSALREEPIINPKPTAQKP